MTNPEDLQTQLQKALAECASLREENEQLKKLLGLHDKDVAPPPQHNISEPLIPYTTTAPLVTNNSSIDEQVTFFRSLFRGREDVYPVRWERKRGNSGLISMSRR